MSNPNRAVDLFSQSRTRCGDDQTFDVHLIAPRILTFKLRPSIESGKRSGIFLQDCPSFRAVFLLPVRVEAGLGQRVAERLLVRAIEHETLALQYPFQIGVQASGFGSLLNVAASNDLVMSARSSGASALIRLPLAMIQSPSHMCSVIEQYFWTS